MRGRSSCRIGKFERVDREGQPMRKARRNMGGVIYLTPYLPVTILDRQQSVFHLLNFQLSRVSPLPPRENRHELSRKIDIHTADLLCALRHLVVV